MDNLSLIIEALLFSSSRPLNEKEIMSAFDLRSPPSSREIKDALKAIEEKYSGNSIELVKVASGYRFQAKTGLEVYISKLEDKGANRFSKAFLETTAIIAYKQPVTRGDIEDIRGISVSTRIIRSLLERNWIKVSGYRDVPGRPTLYVTTKDFLNDLNLRSISELPELPEIEENEEKDILSQAI